MRTSCAPFEELVRREAGGACTNDSDRLLMMIGDDVTIMSWPVIHVHEMRSKNDVPRGPNTARREKMA